MLKKVGIGVAAGLAVLVIVVALQPGAFKIQRSTRINAPAGVVYGFLNDFHAWESWSPWAKLDPNMKTSYTGPAQGEGAVYEWSGNDQVGSGRMRIVGEEAPNHISIQLDFLSPMAASNLTEFRLSPDAAGTRVDWAMTGENGFIGKAFALVMNMDKLVGKDFEHGLLQLKQQAESKAKLSSAGPGFQR